MLWEVVFLLVILKIPVVYLCVVVWWAIKAEPSAEPPVAPVAVTDTPPHNPVGWSPRTVRAPRPHVGRPPRRPVAPRPIGARAEARR